MAHSDTSESLFSSTSIKKGRKRRGRGERTGTAVGIVLVQSATMAKKGTGSGVNPLLPGQLKHPNYAPSRNSSKKNVHNSPGINLAGK